ncbi:MAG: hypothetical protein ACREBI_02485 [Nitrosotalea sp.]
MSKNDIWEALGAIASVGGLFVTIYQAFKKCPCDGNPLPFKAHCDLCNHNHYF